MTYTGRPSAGCDSCRRSRKKCSLDIPACSRCVRLKKVCSGYRDATCLRFRDETHSVIRKAEKRQAQITSSSTQAVMFLEEQEGWCPDPIPYETPEHLRMTSSSSPDGIGLCTSSPDRVSISATAPDHEATLYSHSSELAQSCMTMGSQYSVFDSMVKVFSIEPSTASASAAQLVSPAGAIPLYRTLASKPDDVAVACFFTSFTVAGHWSYISQHLAMPGVDPCMMLAIKACGLAVLENERISPAYRDWSRTTYIQAVSMLNDALRDPDKSRKDESLIAVLLLGFYENLVCDSTQSLQSWKTHMKGATQLLKIRGKAQLRTHVGRGLFREIRKHIIIFCLWDKIQPEPFLNEWSAELADQDPTFHQFHPIDSLVEICYNFAELSSKIERQLVAHGQAVEAIRGIEDRLLRWDSETSSSSDIWRFSVLQVHDSPHVWNGVIYVYARHPIPSVWDTYRTVRIMVTQTQELLCLRSNPADEDYETQYDRFRAVRRKMTDEICASGPATIGYLEHAQPSSCKYPIASATVWPLFFAGKCLIERIHLKTADTLDLSVHERSSSCAAAAQFAWILHQLDYVSQKIGLRLAGRVAAMLRASLSKPERL